MSNSLADIYIIDMDLADNFIMSRCLLYQIDAIVSTKYLTLKFPTKKGGYNIRKPRILQAMCLFMSKRQEEVLDIRPARSRERTTKGKDQDYCKGKECTSHKSGDNHKDGIHFETKAGASFDRASQHLKHQLCLWAFRYTRY